MIPTPLRDEIEQRLGRIEASTRIGGSTQSAVWRISTGGCRHCLKINHEAAGRDREIRALEAIGEALSDRVPYPAQALEGPPPAVLLPWLEGVPAHHLAPTDPDLTAVMRQAGQFSSRLDAIATPSDDLPLSEALTLRWETWARRGRSLLGSELTQKVQTAFDPDVFADARRSWCHRDFEPRNWLVERTPEGPRLWVVDFGQARPDLRLWDLVKLHTGCWQMQSSLREAFFAGFGRSLSEHETRALEQLSLLHGYQTAVWGREHADPYFEQLGLDILRARLP